MSVKITHNFDEAIALSKYLHVMNSTSIDEGTKMAASLQQYNKKQYGHMSHIVTGDIMLSILHQRENKRDSNRNTQTPPPTITTAATVQGNTKTPQKIMF